MHELEKVVWGRLDFLDGPKEFRRQKKDAAVISQKERAARGGLWGNLKGLVH